jgi:hypothetical protein
MLRWREVKKRRKTIDLRTLSNCSWMKSKKKNN